MARKLFDLEQGIHIVAENSDSGVMMLFGAGAPGSLGTFDDAAEQGSVYFRTNGQTYQKFNSGTGTGVWRRMANADDLINMHFRGERVRALTSTAAPATGSTIDLVATPLGGDETPFLAGADFLVDDFILFGANGTEKLMRVSVVSGDVITVVDPDVEFNPPLAEGDVFMVRNYLLDSPNSQESQAIVAFSGGNYVKLGDINWQFATGISLSSGYTAGAGNTTTSDTVESAIQKLDGNLDNVTSIFGVNVQSATDLGTFTGVTITDNTTVKGALQELETLLENVHERAPVRSSLAGVTAAATLDSVLADSYQQVMWLVTISLDSDPARKRSFMVMAAHNGHASADATTADDSISSILLQGLTFLYAVTVDVSGAGAAQVMRLRVSSGGGAAISAKAQRISIASV